MKENGKNENINKTLLGQKRLLGSTQLTGFCVLRICVLHQAKSLPLKITSLTAPKWTSGEVRKQGKPVKNILPKAPAPGCLQLGDFTNRTSVFTADRTSSNEPALRKRSFGLGSGNLSNTRRAKHLSRLSGEVILSSWIKSRSGSCLGQTATLHLKINTTNFEITDRRMTWHFILP